MRRNASFVPLVVIALSALAGCTTAPTAQVTELDVNVAVVLASEARSAVEKPVSVEVGSTVSTDNLGLAEIEFADGSLARLGPDTDLKITELSSSETQRTTMSLDVGETLHRVKKLVSDDAAYEVKTPVGTAAVRGTVFSVVCLEEGICTINVFEGEVEFTTRDDTTIRVTSYEKLVVPSLDGSVPAATPISADEILASEWIASNLDDGASPEPDVEVMNPASGSIAGQWDFTRTLVSSTLGDQVGTVDTRLWTITLRGCQPECTWDVVSDSGSTFELTQTGESFTIQGDPIPIACVDDTGAAVDADASESTTTYSLAVGDNRVESGVPIATGMTGKQTVHREFIRTPNPACTDTTFGQGETVYTVELTRKT